MKCLSAYYISAYTKDVVHQAILILNEEYDKHGLTAELLKWVGCRASLGLYSAQFRRSQMRSWARRSLLERLRKMAKLHG